MSTATNDGVRINHEVEGDGPPLILMPSLLYAGTKDGVFAQTEKSAKAMPDCTFVALPGLDHSDAFYKATEMLVPKVLGFLRTR